MNGRSGKIEEKGRMRNSEIGRNPEGGKEGETMKIDE